MKKFFTTAMLALLSAGAFAQSATPTAQGTRVLSGSISLGNEASESTVRQSQGNRNVYRTIHISSSAGYFVRDGLEVGMGLGLRQYANKSVYREEESLTRDNLISLSPYVSKYIALTDRLHLRGTGYASFGIGNSSAKSTRDSSFKVTHTTNTIGIGVYPELTYFATSRLGFTASFGSLSFHRSSSKPKEEQSLYGPRSSSNFRADLSSGSLGLGINYFITR